jgi:TonB family protein
MADFRVARDQPEIQVRSVSSPQVSQKGYRPVGISDGLVPDGFDPATPTDGWNHRSGRGEDSGWNRRQGGGDAAGVFNTTEPDYPPPDSFIPLEIQPQLITCVKPDYPRLMIEAGLEGIVWVQALVDIDGRVLEAIVARSSGVELLDEAAREASYKNTFSPGIRNGVPVRVWVTYRVEFNLADRRH